MRSTRAIPRTPTTAHMARAYTHHGRVIPTQSVTRGKAAAPIAPDRDTWIRL